MSIKNLIKLINEKNNIGAINFIKQHPEIDFKSVDDENKTALIVACENALEDVALELINTGKSNPGHIDNSWNTALMYACEKSLENVALELIKTGESNPLHSNVNNYTALKYAIINNLNSVIRELPNTINRAGPDIDFTNINIYFYINNIPPKLNIPEIISRKIMIDINSFNDVVSQDGFCTRIKYDTRKRITREGIIGPGYVKKSVIKSNMTIMLMIQSNILIGFATINFFDTYITIDTLCGDSAFYNISIVLVGIVEQFCKILSIKQIKLDSVNENIYKKLGFTETIPNIAPYPLHSMELIQSEQNDFLHIYPIDLFDKPVQIIKKRSSDTEVFPKIISSIRGGLKTNKKKTNKKSY